MSDPAPIALNGDPIVDMLRRKLGVTEDPDSHRGRRRPTGTADIRAALIAAIRNATPPTKETTR